ncbi:MAG: hypothetical protein AB7U73_25325, partial [Pirellulales bacterium]
VTLPELKRIGNETRMRCFLNCGRSEPTGERALAIQADTATKVWKCFQYGCGKGGNLIGLCDLMKSGEHAGGRPRGERFKEIARDLEAMVQGRPTIEPAATRVADVNKPSPRPARNAPLVESEHERVRALVDLPREFTVDPAGMPPEAAAYFRMRTFLTPDVCREFAIGYLSQSSKSLLRGKIVYPFHSSAGELLCFFARDPRFEEKLRRWIAAGRDGIEPVKYVMPKNFHRGLELWGEHIVRKRFAGSQPLPCGLVVVEGANDAVRMLMLGAPTVALCSNTITPFQVERIVALAAGCGQTQIGLMLDADAAGEQGVVQSFLQLSDRIAVRRLWSRASHGGQFTNRQPESLSHDEWAAILASLAQPSLDAAQVLP